MLAISSLSRRFGNLTKSALITNNIGSGRLSIIYFGTAPEDTGSKEHIQKLVNNDKVVVFMKGTPTAPQCGFSKAVMEVLRMHGVNKFSTHNVLADEKLRQGIKDFSNWPTIPQVFFGGEFLGGCDIMIELHQKGELVQELEKIGIHSKIVDNTSKS